MKLFELIKKWITSLFRKKINFWENKSFWKEIEETINETKR